MKLRNIIKWIVLILFSPVLILSTGILWIVMTLDTWGER